MRNLKFKTIIGKLKEYTKQYVEDESGMEIIEAAALIGVAAFLITGILYVANKADKGIGDVGNKIGKEFDDVLNSNHE